MLTITSRFIPSGYQYVLWEGSVLGIDYNDLPDNQNFNRDGGITESLL